MYRPLVWLASIPLVTGLGAQVPAMEWQNALGGSDQEYGTYAKQTSDGGYIVSAWAWSMDGDVMTNLGDCDYWVVKLDALGNLQWKMSLGGSDWENAWNIMEAANGDFLMTGWSRSTDGDVGMPQGDIDVWVVRVDPLGNLVWERSFGGSGWERGNAIRERANGNIIVAARSRSWDGQVVGNHGLYDFWVLELDAGGNLIWTNALGGSQDEMAWNMDLCADGGIVVGGLAESNDGDVSVAMGSYDCWVVKLDSTGALMWEASYGGSGDDQLWDIHQTADGGYVFIGRSGSNDFDVSANNGAWDIWVVKLDALGNLVWESNFGGSANDWGRSIAELPDGTYAAVGFTMSQDGDVGDPLGGADVWVLRIDAMGNLLGEQTFGGSLTDYGNSIEMTADGGFIVAGTTASNDGDVVGQHGSLDAWVFKLLGGPVLPIELVDFTAYRQSGQVVLEWSTASESNSSHFEVERSADGLFFETIGSLPAAGESAATIAYRTEDRAPLQGVNYYRLKLVDLDGSFEHSGLEAVRIHDGQQTEVSAVLSGSSLTIRFGTQLPGPVELVLMDGQGRVVSRARATGASHVFQGVAASDGVYHLLVSGPTRQEHHRFVVVR